jgi:hypothetical protein
MCTWRYLFTRLFQAHVPVCFYPTFYCHVRLYHRCMCPCQPHYWLSQLNLSFANSYIWDYSPLPRPPWNSLCEADIGFKLPNSSRLLFGSRAGRGIRSSSERYRLHRSERLELFRNIECLLDAWVSAEIRDQVVTAFHCTDLRSQLNSVYRKLDSSGEQTIAVKSVD